MIYHVKKGKTLNGFTVYNNGTVAVIPGKLIDYCYAHVCLGSGCIGFLRTFRGSLSLWSQLACSQQQLCFHRLNLNPPFCLTWLKRFIFSQFPRKNQHWRHTWEIQKLQNNRFGIFEEQFWDKLRKPIFYSFGPLKQFKTRWSSNDHKISNP